MLCSMRSISACYFYDSATNDVVKYTALSVLPEGVLILMLPDAFISTRHGVPGLYAKSATIAGTLKALEGLHPDGRVQI